MIELIALRLYEQRLDAPRPPSALPPGVELALWDSPGTADLGSRWHPEAEQRLQDGQACAVARHGKVVVAYCWLTSSPVRVVEIDRVVVPGPEEVYLYDAFTVPAWRGCGLFSTLLLYLLADAHGRGRKRALIFVRAGNRASRHAIERVGFELFGTVSGVGLRGLGRLWLRGPGWWSSCVTLVREADRARP